MILSMNLEDLSESGLSSFSLEGYGDDHIWADISHPVWRGTSSRTIRLLGKLVSMGRDIGQVPIYRCVKDIDQYCKPYFQIGHFKPRKEKRFLSNGKMRMIYGIDPMLRSEKRYRSNERAKALRTGNRAIQRKWMMGDPDSVIVCPIEGRQIDRFGFWDREVDNVFQQHHIVFRNGYSIQKEGEDPGKKNSTTDLTTPSEKSRAVIEDMMRTIFLSPTAHTLVHKFPDGDINRYPNNQLPYALQSKKNYNDFISYLNTYGYIEFPPFKVWREHLTLEYHEPVEL